MSEIEKVGIVITFHNRVTDFVIPCVESVLKYTPFPRYIVLYDNQSRQEESAKISTNNWNDEVEIITIKDQKKNWWLTGTWNQWIDRCFTKNCNKIILLNHDTIVDESWSVFIKNIQWNLHLYAPISNKPGHNYKNYQQRTRLYSEQHKYCLRESKFVNGFCLGFSEETLKNNKYNKEYYFNPEYPFEYNEIEWQKRLKEKNGKIFIVEGCYVFHHKDNAWTHINHQESWLKKCRGIIGKCINKIHPELYHRVWKKYFPYKDYSIFK